MQLFNNTRHPLFITVAAFLLLGAALSVLYLLKADFFTSASTLTEDFSDGALVNFDSSKHVSVKDGKLQLSLTPSSENITSQLERIFAEDSLDLKDWYLGTAASNGKVYLMVAQHVTQYTTPPLILKLDGLQLTNLTRPPSLSSTFSGTFLKPIAYGDDEWLIGGSRWGFGADSARGAFLAKYDGVNFIDLSSDVAGREDPRALVSALSRGSGFWLIGGASWRNPPVSGVSKSLSYLTSYDGTKFTELSSEVRSAGFEDEQILSIGSNNQYFLIGGTGPTLVKYDGRSFVNVTAELKNLLISSGIAGASFVKLYSVNHILFNGEYWLIAGGRGLLFKYDGDNFTPLNFLYPGHEIEDMTFHGKNWLIATSGGRLVKYDGEKFTDFNQAFSDNPADPGGVSFAVGGQNDVIVGGKRKLFLLPEGIRVFKEGEVISETVLSVSFYKKIRQVKITYEGKVPQDASLTLFLSPNGGADWERVETAAYHKFQRNGRNLLWRAELVTEGLDNVEVDALEITSVASLSRLSIALLISGILVIVLVILIIVDKFIISPRME